MRKIACFFVLFATLNIFSQQKTRVAILPIKDSSIGGAYSNLVQSIPDMLMTNISKSQEIVLVERIQIDEAIKHFELERSGYIDIDTAVKVGKWIGADLIVLGNFIAVNDDVRIDVRVVDIRTGFVLDATKISGKSGELFKLIDNLSLKILGLFEKSAGSVILDEEYFITARDIRAGKQLYNYKKPNFKEYDFRIYIPKNTGGCEVGYQYSNRRDTFVVGYIVNFNDEWLADINMNGWSQRVREIDNPFYDVEFHLVRVDDEWFNLDSTADHFVSCDFLKKLFSVPKVRVLKSSSFRIKVIKK